MRTARWSYTRLGALVCVCVCVYLSVCMPWGLDHVGCVGPCVGMWVSVGMSVLGHACECV